jgi:peptide/nickel transport system permease protein
MNATTATAAEPLPHFVSGEPFDSSGSDALTTEQERFYLASQWQLMLWKLKRHKVAVISGIILALMYGSTLVSEVLAPYYLHSRHTDFIYAPPQQVRLFHEGRFVGPFTYDLVRSLNMETLKREYTEDTSKPRPVRFLCSGDTYRFWGLFEASFHLVCPSEGGTLFLAGTDRLGRDVLSRVIYGTRISLTIGLIGIALAFTLGLAFGGIAGYYGGWVDNVIQRVIEVIRSFPELPLWMALSAVLPVTWSPLLVYFGITMILATLHWTNLARPKRIIARHLLPGFMSHLIAAATLSIPGMILGETALSFLGIGLRPPITSWGVLLNEAQNVNVVALYPWLMLPVLPVIVIILAFNFFGDGLRDAADPYR